MKYRQEKVFNLEKECPNVLVLGNGLTRSTGIPWINLIEKIKRAGTDITPYKMFNSDGSFKRFSIPNTILTAATSVTDDKKRRDLYTDIFSGIPYSSNAALGRLLSLPFDAILTTNYSYELEAEILPAYPSLSTRKMLDYVGVTKSKPDSVFLLHTYNQLGGKPDIWHVHGELRRPSSIVLTHDEYAKNVQIISQYYSGRRKEYYKKAGALKFHSWVDYFLLGNVFVLGLGMDYSEFDLWWLLNRRQQEKAKKGKIVFYEGERDGEDSRETETKHYALRDTGVSVKTFGMKTNQSTDYEMFYRKAIDDMESILSPK